MTYDLPPTLWLPGVGGIETVIVIPFVLGSMSAPLIDPKHTHNFTGSNPLNVIYYLYVYMILQSR
jgi:hypothetical protein